MKADWRTRYQLAVDAARQGGDFAKKIYDQSFDARDMEVIRKQDNSPVTIADRGAELLIREMISKHFPNDGFVGEEYGVQPSSTGYSWIIDPIDGTKSFIRHVPIWATLIGLEHEGEQIAGAVYLPVFRQMYRALRGDGAYLDDVRIRTSGVAKLADAILCYSSIQWFTKHGKQDQFLRLYQSTARQRGYGDFYGFVLVAQGSCDLMIEHGVNPWDISATCAIIEEAGGKFTDWDGQPGIQRPDVIASNGHLHEIAREFLRTS